MGFKCSVLGHRFDEPGLVHEREPRGDEVITIRRKVMVCTLCGEQRVIAENKEITKGTHRDNTGDGDDSTVDDGNGTHEREERDETSDSSSDETGKNDDVGTGKNGDVGTGKNGDIGTVKNGDVGTDDISDGTGKDSETVTDERSGDGASIVDESSEGPGIGGLDVVHDQGVTVDGTESSVNAQQDDGIVLSNDSGGRRYGEWPDDSEGIGIDDRWNLDALRGVDVSNSDGAENNDYSGLSPIDTETDMGEILSERSNGDEKTETKTESDEHVGESFCCPSCGFTVAAPDSPFRSGDSCPKCRKEYLIENS